jgi:hypothetical protein
MKITAPGIYRDFDGQAYFDDPCPAPSLNQSTIKVLIERSPLHAMWQHPQLAPPVADDEEAEKYVKAQAIGNAAHALMLGRGKRVQVFDFKAFRKDAEKEARDEAFAAGNVPILKKHMVDAEAMVHAARAQLDHHEAKDAFTDGHAEVVLAWQEDGLWFRQMVDWLSTDLRTVTDYKTTGMSVAPHVLGMRMVDAGWDIQAAMAERALNILDPKNAGRRRFLFVPQENEKPHALNVVEMGEAALTMGRKKIDAAVAIWRRCMETGQWPAYPPRIIVPEYPSYKETQWLEREENEFSPSIAPRAPMLTDLSGG